jgi:MFS family permease
VTASHPAGSAEPQPGFRDLRLYLANRFLSTVAVQFQVVGVGWQVYDITRDPLALGYVGLFEFLPMVVLALPAGDLADRVDRRLILMVTYVVQAFASALLLWLTLSGSQAVWQFYAVVALFGVARGLSTPAQQSALPFLVTPENLPKAVAWNSTSYTLANISGPAIGGLLFAVSAVLTYSVCLLLFLATTAMTLVMRMRQPADLGQHRGTAYSRIVDGVRYTWRHPLIIGAISLDLFAVLLGGAVALLPVYARDILFVGPQGLGVLRAAPAIGAAVVALALARRPLASNTGAWMFSAVALFGVAIVVFGLSRNFYLSVAALAVSGCADLVSVFVRSTMIQLATPDHIRGRVGSVNSLFISASNELGQFRSGVMAAWLGAVPSVVLGGIGTVLVAGLWMYLFPQLRRVDRFADLAPPAPPAAAAVALVQEQRKSVAPS